MLDTGATPCVIDKCTANNLGLDKTVVQERCKVYGLCNNPVKVLGYAMTNIRLGTLGPIIQKVQVLDSEELTILLGQQLMKRLGTVSFDFLRSRIRVGNTWEEYEATVQGATPFARAQVVKQDEELENDHRKGLPLINPQLPDQVHERLEKLAQRFDVAFAAKSQEALAYYASDTTRYYN